MGPAIPGPWGDGTGMPPAGWGEDPGWGMAPCMEVMAMWGEEGTGWGREVMGPPWGPGMWGEEGTPGGEERDEGPCIIMAACACAWA